MFTIIICILLFILFRAIVAIVNIKEDEISISDEAIVLARQQFNKNNVPNRVDYVTYNSEDDIFYVNYLRGNKIYEGKDLRDKHIYPSLKKYREQADDSDLIQYFTIIDDYNDLLTKFGGYYDHKIDLENKFKFLIAGYLEVKESRAIIDIVSNIELNTAIIYYADSTRDFLSFYNFNNYYLNDKLYPGSNFHLIPYFQLEEDFNKGLISYDEFVKLREDYESTHTNSVTANILTYKKRYDSEGNYLDSNWVWVTPEEYNALAKDSDNTAE